MKKKMAKKSCDTATLRLFFRQSSETTSFSQFFLFNFLFDSYHSLWNFYFPHNFSTYYFFPFPRLFFLLPLSFSAIFKKKHWLSCRNAYLTSPHYADCLMIWFVSGPILTFHSLAIWHSFGLSAPNLLTFLELEEEKV